MAEVCTEENLQSLKKRTNQKFSIVGVITLHVSLRDFSVRVALGVLDALSVAFLLETSFINGFLKRISRSERDIVPYNSNRYQYPLSIICKSNPRIMLTSHDRWRIQKENSHMAGMGGMESEKTAKI